MAIRLEPHELEATMGRLEYLAEKHTGTHIEVVSNYMERGRLILTLQIDVGPARNALRAATPQLQASYALLWDLVKVLFYVHPVFTSPPNDAEREAHKATGILIHKETSDTSAVA
jgi:hypothetical protein